ncbi:MAG: hypothetical protein ACJ77A_05925 [Actinomycetota bacterium]
MPLPGPMPRPPQVESEISRSRHDELEHEWARHRAEDELIPHRLRAWWRRLFSESPPEDPD